MKRFVEGADRDQPTLFPESHPFGTIKARMGATRFLMKRLKNVKTEMALAVLAYNLTRVMNIVGIGSLMKAIRA